MSRNPKFPVKQALAQIRAMGCTASYRDGEYRIGHKARSDYEYYTNEASDAIYTAMRIVLDVRVGAQ